MEKQYTLCNKIVKSYKIIQKITFFLFFHLSSQLVWCQTPYVMSGGNYSETFTNIANSANWPNGFNGTDCQEWSSVAINATGSIGDGVKVTTASAVFSTSTTGGVQRGSSNLYMLSTGTTNSCAIDLLLDFTGMTAGTISFDVAGVNNGTTRNRDSKLKVFYSTNGTTFTELTGTNLPFTARNNVISSASISIALPSSFDNSSTARLRFYEYSTATGGTTPTGSQPKISIDNVAVTSTSTASCTPPASQANTISFSSVTNTGTTITWVRGNGTAGVVVVAKAGSAVDSDPVSGTTYTANSSFTGGAQIGTGNYVVYKGTGTSVSVTGLSSGSTYYYSVYEYNTTGTCYKTAGLSGNQLTIGTASTDYFRSLSSGNWNTAGTWQSSADNSTWITSTLVPTSSAVSITIQTAHTVTINGTATASSITIAGTGKLTFDGVAARDFTVTGNITISSSGGSFITQTSGTFKNTMSVAGDITNEGTFDMSRGGSNLVCDVTFNKNGNQSISGAGTITRFYGIIVNMGTSNLNVLEITSSNFSAPDAFLETVSGDANRLKNGTLKLSGSFTYSGCPFIANSFNNTIVSTAGLWLNNSNVTFTGINDSYDISGKLVLTAGTLNIGTIDGNSLKFKTGSLITVEGGYMNVSGRIQGLSTANTTTYNQSGGVVTILTSASNSGTTGGLDFTAVGSSFIMSGGSIVLRNETAIANEIIMYCSSTITGGTIQFGDALTSAISSDGFWIQSQTTLPSIAIYSVLEGVDYPSVFLLLDLTVRGNITIGSSCKFNVSYGGTNLYDISLTGNWINNGIFTARTKTVTFNGATAQSIGGSASTSFYNLAIANTYGGVALGINTTTTNTLTLTSGKLSVQGYSLTIGTSTTNGAISGGSLSSYIIAFDNSGTIGYLKQFINSAGGTSYSYPVGDASNYTPLTYTLTTGSLATADLTVYTKASRISGMNTEITQYINRFWRVTPTGITSSIYTISYTYVDGDIIGGTETGLLPIKKSGTTWYKPIGSSFTTGTAEGNGSVNIGTNTLTWSSLTTYSDDGAAVVGLVTLPIETITFSGKKVGKNNELTWETVSEFNNDFFMIEKTIDGENFKCVGYVNGAGNSTSYSTYSLVDYDVKEVINYYRLRQTDFDGKYLISEMITIDNQNIIDKQISSFTDIIGQKVNEFYHGIVIIIYEDGSSQKIIQ